MESKGERQIRLIEEILAGEWGKDLGWAGGPGDNWAKFEEVREAINILGKAVNRALNTADKAKRLSEQVQVNTMNISGR